MKKYSKESLLLKYYEKREKEPLNDELRNFIESLAKASEKAYNTGENDIFKRKCFLPDSMMRSIMQLGTNQLEYEYYAGIIKVINKAYLDGWKDRKVIIV